MTYFRSLLFFAVTAAAMGGEVRFQAYMTTGTHQLFVLSADSTASGWLSLGQSFEGCLLTAFDARAEELTVEKAGQRLVLPLVASKVVPGIHDERAPAARGITILLPDGDKVVTGDGVAATDALRRKLTELAKADLRVSVTLIIPEQCPSVSIARVLSLVRSSGINRISITRSPDGGGG